MAINSNGNWQPQNLQQRMRAARMNPPAGPAPVGPMDPVLQNYPSTAEPEAAAPSARTGRPGYSYNDPVTQRMQRVMAIQSGQPTSVAEIAATARTDYDTGRDLAQNITPFIPGPNTSPEKAANDLAYLDKLALNRAGQGPRPGAPMEPIPFSAVDSTPPAPVGPMDPDARPAAPAAMPRDYFPAVRGVDAQGNPTLTQSPESLAAAAALRAGGPMNPWTPQTRNSTTVQQLATAERNARLPGFGSYEEAVKSLPAGSKAQIQQNSSTGRFVVQAQIGPADEPGPQSALAKMQADRARALKEGRTEDAETLRQQIENEANPVGRPLTVAEFNFSPELRKEHGGDYGKYRRAFATQVAQAKTTSTPATGTPPPGAVARLKADKSLSAAFDAKYGTGAAARALAQ